MKSRSSHMNFGMNLISYPAFAYPSPIFIFFDKAVTISNSPIER